MHGTNRAKRRCRDFVMADAQAVGLGMTLYEVAQDSKEWEEICRHCCAYHSNKVFDQCAGNSFWDTS